MRLFFVMCASFSTTPCLCLAHECFSRPRGATMTCFCFKLMSRDCRRLPEPPLHRHGVCRFFLIWLLEAARWLTPPTHAFALSATPSLALFHPVPSRTAGNRERGVGGEKRAGPVRGGPRGGRPVRARRLPQGRKDDLQEEVVVPDLGTAEPPSTRSTGCSSRQFVYSKQIQDPPHLGLAYTRPPGLLEVSSAA